MNATARLDVAIPAPDHYEELISCRAACPVHTDARGYIQAIRRGQFREAYLIARGPNPFASICGRVCGAPCETACRRGRIPRTGPSGEFLGLDRPVAIRALKRFACEQAGLEVRPGQAILAALRAAPPTPCAGPDEIAAFLRAGVEGRFQPADGQPVAIVGSGPAGLSAAHDLALLGFRPVVFEAERVPTGMLALGVPAYRLPRSVIEREVDVIRALGVEIRCGVAVGRDVSLAALRAEFPAVLIAVGARASRTLGIQGERGPGVLGGVDLLRAVALGERPPIGRDVVVIGGGNVAYDVARTVLRQIALDTARTAARLFAGRVRLVSLETLEEMPADTVEILEGEEEGIERWNGWGPVEVRRDAAGSVEGVVFRRCLRVYDERRRFAPVFDDGDRMVLPCDTVLLAVGQTTDLSFLADGGADVEMFRPGWPKVDPATLATTAPGVFVAGDLAHGTRLLIDAVASGKAAARSIYRYLTGRSLDPDVVTAHVPETWWRREPGYERLGRVPIPTVAAEDRLSAPDVAVELGYGPEEAVREASRCLDCGVTPVFDGQRCVLCGGCADVCPTLCLKLMPLSEVALPEGTDLGPTGADPATDSVILKDEERCIRCGLCEQRCPVEAITMERVTVTTAWSCP